MKIKTIAEVDIPKEEVYETILKWYYNNAKENADGWSVFGSFESFIECRYNMAIKNDSSLNWEKIDSRKKVK